MRRPLLFGSLCLTLLVAAGYFLPPVSLGDAPPDGTGIVAAGQVCQKDGTTFVIKIQEVVIQDSLGQAGTCRDSSEESNVSQVNSSQINSSPDYSMQRDRVFDVGDKLLCQYGAAGELVIGADLVLEGDFYAFSGATNPGEFDYARYYHSIGYVGRIKNVRVTAQEDCAPGIGETLYRLRCFWQARLYQIFPEKEASIMTAILLGDKSGVDGEVKELYGKTGIIHILSISGLHISLLGMGLYRVLRRLGLPVWAAALCGGAVLVLYGIMTGLGVSVCRAIGMYLIRMLAELLGRTYDMLTALGVVGAGMVCMNPAWLGHMGFLLSFGSILGVGALLPALTAGEKAPGLERYVEGRWRRYLIKKWKSCGAGLWQGFLAGLSITLTTLPVQLWFSYEVPRYSVFLNVLVLPFMGIVMVAGLIAMLIPGMGFVGTADVLILAGYEGLCRLFDTIPDSMWNPGRPQIWQIVVYYLLWSAVVCSAGRRGVGKRSAGRRGVEKCSAGRRSAGRSSVAAAGGRCPGWRSGVGRVFGTAAALGAAVVVIGLPGLHGDRVTFLDVGQGDCICVQLSTGEVYLFDCGSSSRSQAGERVLVPFLKYSGIQRIDAVFASHGDADHINGILELLRSASEEHITVGQLVLPGISRELLQEEFGALLEVAGYADKVSTGAGGNAGAGSRQQIPVAVIREGEGWTAGDGGISGGVPGGGGISGGAPGGAGVKGDCQDYFLCLHPSADGRGVGGNEGSECFYIELREGGNRLSLLLTGDVEGAGEGQLLAALREYGIQDVTVFKVAHHGSKNSTTRELLNQIRPRLSVISCGRNNRYGHPHPELLERLAEAGTTVYDTPRMGAVQVELMKTGARVEGFVED